MKRTFSAIVVAAVLAACTTAPTPSATATPPAGSEWKLVELPDRDHSAPAAIVAAEHDVVVVGGHDFQPWAWVSHDGGAWSSEPLPDNSGIPAGVVQLGDGVVAVGLASSSNCAHPSNEAMWVRSPEGRWVTAPFRDFHCAGGSWTVASTGGRAAIAGTSVGETPFAWTSVDGLDWEEAVLPPQLYVRAVGAAGGAFVALGAFTDQPWLYARNEGGNTWAPGSAEGLPAGIEIVSLLQGGDGLFTWALADSRVELFTSARGDRWRQADHFWPVQSRLLSVHRVGRQYVAIGDEPGGESLFVSDEGLSWRRLGRPPVGPTGQMTDVASSGDGLYVIATSEQDGVTRLWRTDTAVLLP